MIIQHRRGEEKTHLCRRPEPLLLSTRTHKKVKVAPRMYYNGHMNKTIDYYNKNARSYFDATAGADFSEAYAKFCAFLPERARILDAGCGSGRDLRAFRDMGYEVVGLDASEQLAALAREHLAADRDQGAEAARHEPAAEREKSAAAPWHEPAALIICADMATWVSDTPFDGVWACASLLHLEEEKLRGFFGNLEKNLAPGGVLYVSVKAGGVTGTDEKGRYMRYFEEPQLRELFAAAGLEILEFWESRDKLDRGGFTWLNMIGRK